ncbi:hypothetical protein [Shewanella sp.]|uniref:hypothetical protein n=1 Tax=Shewanella sp. TaxID=50422 RepID=UPI0035653E12
MPRVSLNPQSPPHRLKRRFYWWLTENVLHTGGGDLLVLASAAPTLEAEASQGSGV